MVMIVGEEAIIINKSDVFCHLIVYRHYIKLLSYWPLVLTFFVINLDNSLSERMRGAVLPPQATEKFNLFMSECPKR
jgi:hypothetical protein